jgi:hypothetical protein
MSTSRPTRVLGRRRGAVLILAMLVLIALMAVAYVGAEGTMFEINYVGANRLATVGQYVAEGGQALSVGQVAATPGVLSATDNVLTDVYFGGLFYATPGGNGPGIDPETFGMESYAGATAAFTTTFSDPITTNRVPGFSADTFVFTKYTAQTVGSYVVGQPALGDAFQRRAQGSVVGQIFLLTGTAGGK